MRLCSISESKSAKFLSARSIPKPMTYEEPAFDEDKQAYEAVMQLSEPMKTVIILHYYEDLTLKQIAEITDTPLSTVKTRLYSALKKLKLILKEEEK